MSASTSSNSSVRGTSHLDAFLNSKALNTSDARAVQKRWEADRAAAAGPVGFDGREGASNADKYSTKQRAVLEEAFRLRRAETEWIKEAKRLVSSASSVQETNVLHNWS